MKRVFSLITFLALLCGLSCALAYTRNDSGLYVDESGQVIGELWDDAAGIYIVDGVGYEITNADEGGSPASSSSAGESSGGGITVVSSDGSADPFAGIPTNPDGSITVESGQIQIEGPSTGESGHLTEAEWAARWAKYTAANGTTTGTVYINEKGNPIPVEIVSLGLGRSTIRVENDTFFVPTSSLKWDTEAPEDKLLAVVTLPKSPKLGYVTLRAKKSQKSFVMGHCNKGRVLRVIDVGKTWTMVDDAGVRGYVLTSGLTFYDNSPRPYAAGIITVMGKLIRGNYVHLRTSPTSKSGYVRDPDSTRAVEYHVGTPVAVFAQDDTWSEIDVDRWHCYILSKFVTLQEPLPVIEPEDTEPKAEIMEDASSLEEAEYQPDALHSSQP